MHHHAILYETVQVASGTFDAAVYALPHPWDAAAGALLVTEAGGTVTDLAGAQQPYDRKIRGAIFSNGLLHADLVRLIAPVLQAPRQTGAPPQVG
jgi:myo-inositol-1(or 4)-monophosphatase